MNRVKSLSKSGNPRKDLIPNSVPQSNKDVSSSSTLPASAAAEDFSDQRQEKPMDLGRRPHDKESTLYSSAAIADKHLPSVSSNYLSNGREEKGLTSASMERERERFEMQNSYNDSSSQKMNSYSQNDTDEKVQKKNSYNDSSNQKMYSYSQNDTAEKVQKVSPPRRKVSKDEKSERPAKLASRDYTNVSDVLTSSSKQQITGNHNTVTTGSRLHEAESAPDKNINAVLEVCKICWINDLFITSFQLNTNY